MNKIKGPLIDVVRKSKTGKTEEKRNRRWMKYLIYIALIIVLTSFSVWKFGPFIKEGLGGYGYFGVFVAAFIVNASIVIPVPMFVLPIATGMVGEAGFFSLTMMSVVCVFALGATFGECIGYFAGYTGRKIINIEENSYYQKLEKWLRTKGWQRRLIIFILSILPFPPFDVVGILAGTLRYSIWEFFLCCFFGRFFKYWFLTWVFISGAETWKSLLT